jgi:signal transduction histidine kinase/ligand-binding sensor domain-containing protein
MCAARSIKARTVFRAVLLLAIAFTLPVEARTERLPVKVYTTSDGLARDTINRIVPDSRGFLWFCTDEGLSRFDGYKFTNYGIEHGMPHRRVNDLIETRGGQYWIATGGGLCLFNPTGSSQPHAETAADGTQDDSQRMFVVFQPEATRARAFTALLEDRAGVIWCGTEDGLYRLEQVNGQWALNYVEIGRLREAAVSFNVFALRESRDGALWIGTWAALYRRWPDGRTERYTSRDGLPMYTYGPNTDLSINPVFVHALLEDREGHLWVGTRLGGVCELAIPDDGSRAVVSHTYTTRDGLAGNWINSVFQSSDGRLWVGTEQGLSLLIAEPGKNRKKFKSYTTAHGLSSNDIDHIAEDASGNLWMAADGAVKMARSGFTTYNASDGLAHTPVRAILENKLGELCIISKTMVIMRFDGTRFTATRPALPANISNIGWGWNQIHLQDREGQWWIPTGDGLCRYPQVNSMEELARTKPKAVYTTRDGLSANEVFRLFEDSRGDLWISTLGNSKATLTRWERTTERFHQYGVAQGIPASAPSAFCEDASGNIWMGFYGGGLYRYASGRFEMVGGSVTVGFIRDLYLDRTGRLWAATDLIGIIRIDSPNAAAPQTVNYTTAQGLASNQIHDITEDQWGRIYAVTGRGIDRLDAASGRIKHYTQAEGLFSTQLRIAFRDREGALWFGGYKGVSKFLPEPEAESPPPPIFISGLRISGFPHRLSELGETEVSNLSLAPDQRRLEIDFFGISLAAGDTLRYQYYLEGVDKDWSIPSEQRTISLSLAPGSYRFLIRAISSDGAVSPSPAIVSFTLHRPIWQRWWFIALAVGLAGLMIYGAARYRVARLIELERVRTRIATDLHDDIGSNLSLIAMVSEVARQQVNQDSSHVTDQLALVARTSRQSVDTMSDIVWAVNPRRDHLHDLIERMRRFASDTLAARDIVFRFAAPSSRLDMKLGSELRRQVYMIFKEAINNMARHSECTEADIDLSISGGQLMLRLADNGKGFDTGSVSNGYGGNGLASMSQRAAARGGTLAIVSQRGEGTTLTLKVPLGRHR